MELVFSFADERSMTDVEVQKKAYDIYAVNVALFEHGEPLLSSQAS